MSIRLEQPGGAKAAATAGTMIGKSERAKEDRARAEREQARADQMAAQREARKAAMKWEQEKMALRSQQDFQQELTEKQWEFEKFNRAKAWQIDKMEIASRMDFERDEKKRTQEIDVFINGVESINKSETIDDKGKERALYNWATKHPKLEEAAQYLGYASGKESIFNLLDDSTPKPEPVKGIQTFTNPKTKEPIYVPDTQPFVTVRLPNGSIKKIRAEQLQEAMDTDGAVYVPQTNQPVKTSGLWEDIKKGKYGTGAAPLFGGGISLGR